MAHDSPFELRLSAAGSWVKCGAYPSMNRRPEAALLEEDGDHTVREEGIAMHWVAEMRAAARVSDFPEWVDVGSIAPNGVVITDELLDGALFYLDALDFEFGGGFAHELQLPAPSIHPKCGGTIDAVKVDFVHGRRPHVIVPDLKGGLENVEVFPNYQLFGYASAAIDHFGLTGQDVDVTLAIVQPRSFHRDGPVRKHVTTSSQLVRYWDEMRHAAAVAAGDFARAVAGRQCDRCNARTFCDVAIRAGQRALEIAGEPNVINLTPAAVDYELMRIEDARRMLEARYTALYAQAEHMSRNGQQLTHYDMAQGRGNLAWLSPEHEREAIAIADTMGVNIRKDERAKTPTQSAKLLDPKLIEHCSDRPRGKLKLTRIDANAAAKAFSHLGVE